jgi:hypothetical protein
MKTDVDKTKKEVGEERKDHHETRILFSMFFVIMQRTLAYPVPCSTIKITQFSFFLNNVVLLVNYSLAYLPRCPFPYASFC